MKNKNRPILRYHGGKWRLAPWIMSNFPDHRVYVEPFCGAANVLLRKTKVSTEVLNDLNGRLVNVFRVLRDKTTAMELKHQLFNTPCAAAEYFEAKEIHPEPIEDARRMIVLGQQCFGSTGSSGGKSGGWRRNIFKDRDRSTADVWASVHEYVESWSDRLRGVYIDNKPATDVISQWDTEKTLFYVDPPYLAETREGPGNRGYAHEMTNEDHVKLADCLTRVKGCVVLSGYNSTLYDSLYSGWQKVEKDALAEKGKKTTECLWIHPNAENLMEKHKLFRDTGGQE